MKRQILPQHLNFKILVCCLAILVSLLICAQPALACTGVYVGSEASSDNTIIIAKSNDTSPLDKPFIEKVYGGNDGEQITEITEQGGFNWKLPNPIHRTVCFPTVKSADGHSYCAVAMNDLGVMCNATVSAYSSKESLKYNPLVKDGLVEDQLPLIVAASVSSAREGIELVAKIIDEKGSGEDNIIMIADQSEAYYMEIYGGHQYCAVKAPADCVAVIGNEFMLETVDENSPNTICSKDLFTLPKEKGFAVYAPDGKMNLSDTYAGVGNTNDSSHMRTWRGHQYMSPSTVGQYSITTKYPLFYKPDKKVAVTDVMEIYRDRYEGTPYSLDTNGKGTYRPIGIDKTQSTHVTQIYKNLPANNALIDWITFANSEFNTYVPFSNGEKKVDEAYTHQTENYYNYDITNPFSAHRNLSVLTTQNRPELQKGVRDYWKVFELYNTQMMEQLLDREKNNQNAQEKIDNFCESVQKQTYYDTKRLIEEINWYLMNTENNYGVVDHDGTQMYVPPESYVPYIDAALIAKIFGWNVDVDKLQDHNPGSVYDQTIWGDQTQGDNGGQEGYVKISSGDNVAEIYTHNNHRTSNASVSINGVEQKDLSAKVYDGKTYVSLPFCKQIAELSNYEMQPIQFSDLSPERSYNKSLFGDWANISKWPLGFQILLICVFVLVIVTLIYCTYRLINKKRTKKQV